MNREKYIVNGLVVAVLTMLAIIGMMIVNSCNTIKQPTKPIVYKDALFLHWSADNEQEVNNYTLQYSWDQKIWGALKSYKVGDGNYFDTINYLSGYYRIKVNLQSSKSDSSNIVSVK